MKRLLVLLVLLVGMCLSGCGMVYTYTERERRYKEILDFQSRMMVDDWDYFWLAERPSYMTYWHVRQVE